MPRHAFAAYKLQISESGQPDLRVPVADIDGKGLGLLDIARDAVKSLESSPVTEAGSQYHLSLEQQSVEEPRLEIKLSFGRYGTSGAVKNVLNHKTTHQFGKNESATSELRNLLVVPAPGEYALFFAERYQGRGAGSAFLKYFKEYVDAHLPRRDLILKHDRLADAEAFRRFLEKAKLSDIEIIEYSAGPDLFNQVAERPVGTISHKFTPGWKQRWLPDPLRDKLLNRTMDVRALFGLRDHADVKETRLTLKNHQQQKTVVLDETEQVPSLTYQLAADEPPRPEDPEVYSQMLEVSNSICQQLGLGSY